MPLAADVQTSEEHERVKLCRFNDPSAKGLREGTWVVIRVRHHSANGVCASLACWVNGARR